MAAGIRLHAGGESEQHQRMQDFKKLRVWHQALRLSLNVLHSMDRRRYALYPAKRAQTFRSAESIASNISEGSAKSNPEFARFLDMSLASAKELENHLLFALEAGLIPAARCSKLLEHLEHLRRGLINLLRKVRGSG